MYFLGDTLTGDSSSDAPVLSALNNNVSLRTRACITFTSANLSQFIQVCTVEETVLLTENTSDAVHEITTQSECKRFVSIREKGAGARHVDRKNIPFLQFFQR